ncbi:MAG: AAA family ATPase, partial [Chloroflexus sp.]
MTDRMLGRIKLEGYTTFRELDLDLRPIKINVLIGANGVGKSNLIALFTMLNQMIKEDLQRYVARAGGADRILHYGRKTTERMVLELW